MLLEAATPITHTPPRTLLLLPARFYQETLKMMRLCRQSLVREEKKRRKILSRLMLHLSLGLGVPVAADDVQCEHCGAWHFTAEIAEGRPSANSRYCMYEDIDCIKFPESLIK